MEEPNVSEASLYRDLLLKFGDRIYEFLELAGAVTLAVVATISISEMASRESFASSVEAKVISLNADLANVARSIEAGPESDSSPLSEDAYNSRKQVISQIREFENLNDRIATLINVGVSSGDDTLASLNQRYQVILLDNADAVRPAGLTDVGTLADGAISFLPDTSIIYRARSDHLLALAIVSCSALGAMIFGLRSGTTMSVRTMTSGLATGFVVYLALKGGQHLFLLSSPEDRIASNPYSSAFAGLLAGLFSDKAYKVLSSLADDLASRIESSTSTSADSKKADGS